MPRSCPRISFNLFYGVVIGIVVEIFMYLILGRITFTELSKAFISGFSGMFLMFGIILSALTLQMVLAEIGMSDYIINSVAPYVSPTLLPAVAFVIVAALSFITGSCWGVPTVTTTQIGRASCRERV